MRYGLYAPVEQPLHPPIQQAVATGGMSIGYKAMNNAAKVIAMTSIDIFNNPAVIGKAKKELSDFVGPDFQYKSMIGDRKPPLDFRKGKQ